MIPAEETGNTRETQETPAAAQPSAGVAQQDGRIGSFRMDEWPADSPARDTPDAAASEPPPSLADLISHTKPQALREERWPSWPPDDERRIRELL